MKQINLLPKSERQELKLQLFSEQFISFWIWVMISLVFLVGLTYSAKIYLSGQVASAESQINLEKQVLKTSDNEMLKQKVDELNNQINLIKSMDGQHYYWSKALVEVGNLLPTDISLDSLSMDRTTGKVDIKGTAADRESVLKFWANIHKSEIFRNVNFPLENLNRPKDDPFVFSFFIVPDKLKTP